MTIRAFITGASGTGKSTLVGELARSGVAAFDMDHIRVARWQSQFTGEPSDWLFDAGDRWHREHDWIVAPEKLDRFLGEHDPRVIAGLAANQTEILDRFDVSILLTCPEETFLRRIDRGGDKRYGKGPSERARILRTYQEMEREMLDRGAIALNTDRALEAVVGDVLAAIR